MRFTTSSLIITLIISTILIFLFSILLTTQKSYKYFRNDFIFTLGLIIILRLFFPFELFFTQSISLPSLMNPIISFLNFKLINSFSTFQILLSIWIIGIVINFIRLYKNIDLKNKCVSNIISQSKLVHVQDYININYKYNNMPIYITKYINSPTIFSNTFGIFLPDINYSDSEIKNIIIHEIIHIKNKDILTKQAVNMLTIIYWWFSPIYLLKKDIELVIEMNVDCIVTKNMNSNEVIEYAESLINVLKKLNFKNKYDIVHSSNFIIENKRILEYRTNYLIEGISTKKTSKLFLCFLIILPFISNSIIFKASFPPLKKNDAEHFAIRSSFKSNDYIIKHHDGTYSLVINNQILPINKSSIQNYPNLIIIED